MKSSNLLESFRIPIFVLGSGLALVALLVCAAGFLVTDLRNAATRRAEQVTGNLALSLVQDIDQVIHATDLALVSAAQSLQRPGLDDLDPQLKQSILFDASDAVHSPAVVFITDRAGRVRYASSTDPANPASIADKSYFQYLEQHAESDRVISRPLRGVASDKWVIVVARRLGGPGQPFSGIVAGLIELSHIQSRFETFDLGTQGSITLANDDGEIILRRPFDETNIGRNVKQAELVRRSGYAPNGSYEMTSIVDGVNRFYSYRRILGLPLVVSAGMSTQDLYAGWRQKTWIIGILVAALVALGAELARQLCRGFSARARAEALLRENEVRYQLLLQSDITDALYLIGPDGRIESWNNSATRMKGWTAEEAVGRNYAMLFTPEDTVRGEPALWLERCRSQGLLRERCWRLRKDGTRFQAWVTLQPIYWDDETIRGFVKVTRDSTIDRIEQEQRAIIIEAAPNGMMIIDEAGTITLANSESERVFGYDRGALVAESVGRLVPDAFGSGHAELRSGLPISDSDRATQERCFRGRKRDGSEVTVELMLSPVQTPSGPIVIIAVSDITERVRLVAEQDVVNDRERIDAAAARANLERLSRHLAKARDAAELASRAKTRFLAGMSHELRTPLNGILGYAHLLELEGGLNPLQRTRVAAMLATGQHLLEMISCVLDLSEIEAERVELRLIEFDVQVTATACLDLVRPMADEKGLSIRIKVEPGTKTTLISDVTRLRQILLNLLGNATKFTSRGSVELCVRTAADGAGLRFEVVDTGPGIPDQQVGRLFQDFERAEAEATRMIEGAGLGLALSSRLATIMGGRLGYTVNPTGGSIFWLELPTNRLSPASLLKSAIEPAESEPATLPDQLDDLVILVVDDVLMNRDIAGTILSSAGHNVICVESGEDAVAAVRRTQFDVVLMDVRMPGIGGLEATRRIRALDSAHSDVPIIALTAQAFVEQISECHAAGMDSHLAKPFNPDALLQVVSEAVAAHRGTPASRPAAKPPAQGANAIPLIDGDVFRKTWSLLTPEAALSYLETIVELATRLSANLRVPFALTSDGQDLAGAAHKLAGSAGLFGLKRVAALSGRFEHAVLSNKPEASLLADSLATAIVDTLQDARLPGPSMVESA